SLKSSPAWGSHRRRMAPRERSSCGSSPRPAPTRCSSRSGLPTADARRGSHCRLRRPPTPGRQPMFRRCRGIALIALLPALGLAPTARSTIVAPGYTVNEIPLPDFATGDIVVAGGALFAGVGSFGGATESVVRIDGSGTHVIANGFNSLGGF